MVLERDMVAIVPEDSKKRGRGVPSGGVGGGSGGGSGGGGSGHVQARIGDLSAPH